MLEVFHEADVRHLEPQAPGTGIGHLLVLQAAAVMDVVAHDGREHAVGAQAGQTLGTVLDVAVVTAAVPAEDAGPAPVRLVFHKGLGQPALPLCAAAYRVHAAFQGIVAAHAFHIAVVELELDVPGIEGRDGHGQTGPEQAAVHLVGIEVRKAAGPGGGYAEGIGPHAGHGVAVVPDLGAVEGVLAADAVQHPGGHLETFKTHGQGQAPDVHVVEIVGIALGAVVVVEGAQPEGRKPHGFRELPGGHDPGHIQVARDGRVACLGGQGQVLQAHADLQAGVGHLPVHEGHADLDGRGAVGPQGAAAGLLAPLDMADLEMHAAGQALRGDSIHLEADAGTAVHDIIAVGLVPADGFDEVPLRQAHAHLPDTFGLEVDGLGIGGSQRHGGGDKENGKLLHPSSPLSSDTRECLIFYLIKTVCYNFTWTSGKMRTKKAFMRCRLRCHAWGRSKERLSRAGKGNGGMPGRACSFCRNSCQGGLRQSLSVC